MSIRISLALLLLIIPLSLLRGQSGRTIPVMNFDEFAPILAMNNDTTYVINFWATWCVPCRKELPYFEKVYQENKDSGKTKVVLVSLDFKSKIESSLLPYLEKNKITAPVVLLSDPNSNAWINKVDPEWTGSLPATIIYRGEKRKFFEAELDYNTLNKTISNINQP